MKESGGGVKLWERENFITQKVTLTKENGLTARQTDGEFI